MEVHSTGTATFKINSTNETIDVLSTDLEWECEGDGERSMGPEQTHSAEFEVAGHNVKWSLSEYPIGVLNHSQTNVPDGVTLVSNIEYTLVHRS